ncbi:hypothetical protein CBER1_11566 [Cercospora berteroae]|uniref:Uncharacterized protein n=1 Tax=Cercospora berteroae TaxID=357750 RepID=A0A2S6BZL2_9PEZI|nr:hypothetical protein CBER1_11566 [Cercospora berteroae]
MGLMDLVAPLLSFIAVAPLLVSTVLMGDWFGLGNACAIVCSILVRSFIMWQRRRALDSVAAPETVVDVQTSQQSEKLPQYREKSLPPTPSTHSSLESVRQLHRKISAPTSDDIVKLLITRADGKMVTIYTPRQILNTFVHEAKLSHPQTYHLVRYCGWTAFGVQMCILGMASLFTQIYTVILLVFSTWALSHSFNFDVGRKTYAAIAEDGTLSDYRSTHFGNKLEVEQENPRHGEGGGVDKRMHAYVRLQPTERQEAMLKHWSMLPFEGVPWYDNYHQAKVDYAASIDRVAMKSPLSSSPSQQS